ncbi:MAG: ABC transporter ATP-binding protein [Candidatus Dormibacteraceae bacterium]
MLEVRDLCHRFAAAAARPVIEGLTFMVDAGQFVTIVGPSGTGKTTLLRIVSGLIRPTAGSVEFEGRPLSGSVPPAIAIVFQDYSRSLFPWMSVRSNLELPLRVLNCTSKERQDRIAESLAAVGLTDYARSYPWQLSGGMQQRVAIARALACRPQLLVMDEPFASLDAFTRANLEDLLLSVHARYRTTILFVTHDIDESVYLSDRVLVLSSRPARLLADWRIDLERPRDQVRTRQDPGFVDRRAAVAALIRDPNPALGTAQPV